MHGGQAGRLALTGRAFSCSLSSQGVVGTTLFLWFRIYNVVEWLGAGGPEVRWITKLLTGLKKKK